MATIDELYILLRQLAGGATSLQELKDILNAGLDLDQDPLIGTAGLLLDGTEQTIYDVNGAGIPWKFEGGYIDLSALIATDTVIIRFYATSGDGVTIVGRQISIDAANTYTGAVSPPNIVIGELPPTAYEIKITIQCTAHVAYKTVYPHFYDSVRGG
ncbi:MAG: hypothetical protein V1767_00965 [Chloroflexota bacterium]